MKFTNLYLAITLVALFFVSACSNNSSISDPKADLSAEIDSVSYALGLQSGKYYLQQGLTDLDLQNFAAGIKEGLDEKNDTLNMFSEREANLIIQTYLISLTEEQNSENIETNKAFLEENREKEGIQETESGLQYKVIEEGSGASPDATDRVHVHYTGRLIDGTFFDTSRKEVAQENGAYNAQREPYEGAKFSLNRVIPGWTEGLQLMKEGAVYKFYIPSEIGYGSNPPQGSPIKPGSVLVFEVELIEVIDSE
ncbi:MAG: FKBP-type peptidyl-prolyl cis-trans isomerase [Balneolaceae bacterium]|nr:FKBP-type peptidyl-prolyl cis-trans isomerase [Balneolaceae bacterium]